MFKCFDNNYKVTMGIEEGIDGLPLRKFWFLFLF